MPARTQAGFEEFGDSLLTPALPEAAAGRQIGRGLVPIFDGLHGLKIEHGALQATGTWLNATPTQIYFANTTAVALELIQRGATAGHNIVVLHSDDAWERMSRGPTSHRHPMRALGRTGRQPLRHVSIRRLLRSAPDFVTLEQRFEEEVTI